MTLFLRTCKKDGTSYNGYKWDLTIGAINEAKDYNADPVCGGGLHGLKNGIGSASYLDFSDDAVGVVFSAEEDIVEFDGKAKARKAKIEFTGTIDECAIYIHEKTGLHGIIKQTATAGYGGTATAGYRGTATAGYGGTATAGYRGTATAGDEGTATAGDEGTATAGYRGTATAGYRGTATAGYRGTATAGYEGTATAGDEGTATAGYRGTATAGYGGTVIIKYWNGKRHKFKIGYVGEDGIKPNVKYRLDDEFNFVEV